MDEKSLDSVSTSTSSISSRKTSSNFFPTTQPRHNSSPILTNFLSAPITPILNSNSNLSTPVFNEYEFHNQFDLQHSIWNNNFSKSYNKHTPSFIPKSDSSNQFSQSLSVGLIPGSLPTLYSSQHYSSYSTPFVAPHNTHVSGSGNGSNTGSMSAPPQFQSRSQPQTRNNLSFNSFNQLPTFEEYNPDKFNHLQFGFDMDLIHDDHPPGVDPTRGNQQMFYSPSLNYKSLFSYNTANPLQPPLHGFETMTINEASTENVDLAASTPLRNWQRRHNSDHAGPHDSGISQPEISGIQESESAHSKKKHEIDHQKESEHEKKETDHENGHEVSIVINVPRSKPLRKPDLNIQKFHESFSSTFYKRNRNGYMFIKETNDDLIKIDDNNLTLTISMGGLNKNLNFNTNNLKDYEILNDFKFIKRKTVKRVNQIG